MIEKKILDCGVPVVIERIPQFQSVSVGIWVKAGAVDEKQEIAGISHFIEHMMFKGTEKRTAGQIASDVDKIGGQFNAFTGKEATCYYMKTLSENAEQAAEILLDMLINSKMEQRELERERRVICEEIKMSKDDPDDDAHETICELVMKGDPLSHSILGTPETLNNIDHNVMKGYIQQEYTRDHIVISLAGNFNEERIYNLLERELSVLPATKPIKKRPISVASPAFQVKKKDIEQTHLCLATRSLALEEEGYYAMGLLANILGGGMSSRLFQHIREQLGLAYSVYAMNASYARAGYFTIYAGVAHDKVGKTIEKIREELKLLKKEGVTAEELEMAKTQMKSAYVFGQENVNGRMFSNGKNMLLFQKIHPPEEIVQRFNDVTLDDILQSATLIGDINTYCGAAVTGKGFPLQEMVEGKL